MTRTIAAVSYWLATLVITLGAYGHGFRGVIPVREAIAASNLAPDTVRVLWIVWYWVSACMVAFGALLCWAWPRIEAGSASRSGAALMVGVLYVLTGAVAYLYSGREPFWLMFLVLGVMVIGSTLVLRNPRGRHT